MRASSTENIGRLRRLLKDLDPRHRMTAQKLSFLETPPPGMDLKNICLRTRLGVLDILSEVFGVGDFARLRANAREVILGGRVVRVMSIGDLIAGKEALARDKDLLVAKELRASRFASRKAGTSGCLRIAEPQPCSANAWRMAGLWIVGTTI